MIHFTFSQQIHNFLIQFTCTWSRFYDVSQLSRGGSRVVTLLCKRRIIAFDPYLNSWKGFKTGLEEMWLLLKASLRTKGWIHLKCIGFLWPKSQLCDCHKNDVASANSLLILFFIYTGLFWLVLCERDCKCDEDNIDYKKLHGFSFSENIANFEAFL